VGYQTVKILDITTGAGKMSLMQLFGTSGIRRLFDEDLVQLALRVGMALGEGYGSVVVASDTRTSAGALKHALISGLWSGRSQLPLPSPARRRTRSGL